MCGENAMKWKNECQLQTQSKIEEKGEGKNKEPKIKTLTRAMCS